MVGKNFKAVLSNYRDIRDQGLKGAQTMNIYCSIYHDIKYELLELYCGRYDAGKTIQYFQRKDRKLSKSRAPTCDAELQ